MVKLEYKPDYEEAKKRFEAFWNFDVADRPPAAIRFRKDKAEQVPYPHKEFTTPKDWWLDVDFRAESSAAHMANTIFYADAMPVVMPNLGPEIFSTWYGCNYNFTWDTTWADPCIHDWERDDARAKLDFTNPLFQLLDRFTRKLIEYGRDKFIVGLTDFHAGGDHIAALRDPQNLCTDLIDYPEYVKARIRDTNKDYFTVYDYFYTLIRGAGMPISSWLPIAYEGKYYIPSNDFSCMISPAMFEEFFLGPLTEECAFYDRCIYHLDGPNALGHLDMLLSIKELHAIQWVAGAGNEGFDKWIPLYQKIQKAKKGVYLGINITELDSVISSLRPEGIYFDWIGGVNNREEADRVLERLKNWK